MKKTIIALATTGLLAIAIHAFADDTTDTQDQKGPAPASVTNDDQATNDDAGTQNTDAKTKFERFGAGSVQGHVPQ